MKRDKTEEGYCVSCPSCGRMNQRSVETVSHIHCARCHHDFTVFLKDKTMLIIIDGIHEEAAVRAYRLWDAMNTMRMARDSGYDTGFELE